MTTRRTLLTSLLGLGAGALWLPTMHLAFRRDPDRLAAGLAERQLRVWEADDRGAIEAMRGVNPEWDFMARTFLVVALANLALRPDADKPRLLAVMDQVIRQTLAEHDGKGVFHYLLPYAFRGPFRGRNQTLFVEGELALMIEARRRVETAAWLPDAPLENSLRLMEEGPVRCGESYPNECWTFCNTAALAAMALAGRHRNFARAWVDEVAPKLRDPGTGMLVSSFTWDGLPLDGPEGSSIWAAATFLQLVDPDFARDQYQRARHHMGRQLLGFGWGVEWPRTWQGPADVDSGPIVPIVGASPGSSGLALLAARAFGDEAFADALVASLGLAAFPIHEDGALAYAASNQLGDAMLLLALSHGPLWEAARCTTCT